MAKTLFLSEKPSVGREIASALGGEWSSQDGYMENDDYIVSWARGHLVSLAEPDAYNPRYKRWRVEDLPIVPPKFKLQPIYGCGKQIGQIKKLLKRSDVSLVVNACDAGREGELIFTWILDFCAPSKPAYTVERLWLSSLTESAIKEALGHRRPATEMVPLQMAAKARAAADWVVGINGTRAASIHFRPVFNSSSSVGRVQTPTLAMLVAREKKIEAFATQPRFALEASFTDMNGTAYTGRWRGPVLEEKPKSEDEDEEVEEGEEVLIDEEESKEKEKDKEKEQEFLPTKADAERIKAEVEASAEGSRVLFELVDEPTKEGPPLPYDLTALQREANKKWKFSAAKTLEIAQGLYERYKAITYPRTDSRYLSTDLRAEMPALFASLEVYPTYKDLASPLVAQGAALTHPTRPYADDKVSDHHALLPTAEPTFKSFFSDQVSDPEAALPADHFKVYDLIVRRTLAIYYPEAVSRSLRARTSAGEEPAKHIFLTKGKGLLEPGWRGVYGRKPQPEKVPTLAKGKVTLGEVKVVESESKPPKHYNEGTLLKSMETAGRDIKEVELREAMKKNGLGTPATRAATIERLLSVGYIKRQRGELLVTDKGRQLIDFLGDAKISSPELTGDWESRLRTIEEGGGDAKAFWQDIVAFAHQVLDEIARVPIPEEALAAAQEAQREALGPPLGQCPHCGELVRKTPRAWSCWQSGDKPGCGFAIWRTISGREISDEEATLLIKEGHTGVLEGFKKRDSNDAYAATLVIKRMPGGSHAVTFELAK